AAGVPAGRSSWSSSHASGGAQPQTRAGFRARAAASFSPSPGSGGRWFHSPSYTAAGARAGSAVAWPRRLLAGKVGGGRPQRAARGGGGRARPRGRDEGVGGRGGGGGLRGGAPPRGGGPPARPRGPPRGSGGGGRGPVPPPGAPPYRSLDMAPVDTPASAAVRF